VSPDELRALVNQYRAGLEAEMALLHQLETLAARQRELAVGADLSDAPSLIDVRDRVMANLVAVEHELKPIRTALSEHRAALEHLADYDILARHHREAAALVSSILASDHQSMDALREAEEARRFASKSVEQGESTLAAYRRVIAPPLTAATLVNRKG
jgi:hypothetical protein